jgi:hypothetical protein
VAQENDLARENLLTLGYLTASSPNQGIPILGSDQSFARCRVLA